MAADSDLVRRLTDDVFLKGNLAALDEIVGADFVSHDPPPGYPGDREGLRTLARAVTGAFSNRKLEFDDFIPAADGRIVENWAMTATHTGDLFGVPASGKPVRVRGIEIWRCHQGRIVEHWGSVDMSDVAQKGSGG